MVVSVRCDEEIAASSPTESSKIVVRSSERDELAEKIVKNPSRDSFTYLSNRFRLKKLKKIKLWPKLRTTKLLYTSTIS